jgi:hypothetical protein
VPGNRVGLRERLKPGGQNGPLVWTALVNAALLLIGLAVAPFDSRRILGLNPWIKPAKFELSIILYVLTLAWLLSDLRGFERLKQIVRWGVSISMITEIVTIAGQAARGTRSHFNMTTPADQALFFVMGAMIGLNGLFLLSVLVAFLRSNPALAPAYLWGIRFGLLSILLASGEGGLMIAHNSHTVGAPDGGPGLPFINWSTHHGDLRVPHFIGMHGLQVLPLAGWALSRTGFRSWMQIGMVTALFALWISVAFWSFNEALAGRPVTALLG